MTCHASAPASLTGDLLFGTNAVRFIFMDEAGTSGARVEQTCVVVGVIMHADNHLMAAEALLREALSAVPDRFRDGFVFHAEDIMNNDKYREHWRLTDRVELLKEVMAIPTKLKLGIAFGQCWEWAPHKNTQMPKNDEHHALAFAHCIAKADQYIRDHGTPEEIGTIVAESHHLRAVVANCLKALRERSVVLSPQDILNRKVDDEQGYNSQKGVLRVRRIRKTIHFVGKGDDELVWIADAVAYGLKRYFAALKFGDQFGDAIMGNTLNKNDFRGPASGMLLVPR